MRAALLAAALAGLTPGCGSILSTALADGRPAPFAGVVLDGRATAHCVTSHHPSDLAFVPLCLLDAPLSLAADLLLLPFAGFHALAGRASP